MLFPKNVTLKSLVLTFIQFLILFFLFLQVINGGFPSVLSLVFYFFSIFLGVSAVYAMRNANFNIVPNVSDDSIMVTNGIYKFIRHPMYSSLLFFALGVVINLHDMLTMALFVFLLVDLYLKASYEEKELCKKHKNYVDYMQSSDRFFPVKFVIRVKL
ncbi:MAG: hypothetical protein JW870_16990 [Candidatus Delongbacteria bacterium]|nr:hypothetical protein [Candidatus Delongbacteria bacterium]